jgi:quercetin dioxygenase-like cupin family protein
MSAHVSQPQPSPQSADPVMRWDEARDGHLTEDALRAAIEAQGFSVTRYVYPPGTRFGAHSHGLDKIDAVLAGRFRLAMGGRSVVLEAGDRLFVPAGAVHTAEVVGDEAVVSLDAVRVG